jgi:hypothetical protein
MLVFISAPPDPDERRLQRRAVHGLQRQRQPLQHAVADGLTRQLERATLAFVSALTGALLRWREVA